MSKPHKKLMLEYSLTLIFLIFMMIGIDNAIKFYFGSTPAYDSYFRFKYKLTANDFERQLNACHEANGFTIAFIGDSVIRGAAVKEDSSTPAAYLQKMINNNRNLRGKVKIFNFGVAGARESDKYAILKKLCEKNPPDMVIMNVSYPFFSQEIMNTKIQFPEIYGNILDQEEKATLGVKNNISTDITSNKNTSKEKDAIENNSLENIIKNSLANNWGLYKYRNDINLLVFGGAPSIQLKKLLENYLGHPLADANPNADTAKAMQDDFGAGGTVAAPKDRPENIFKPYYSFPWNEPELSHLKKVYDVKDINNNIALMFLEKSCVILKNENIPAYVFLTPVNKNLLENNKLINQKVWTSNSQYILESIQKYDGEILVEDYQDSIDSKYFHDSLHLLDKGNQLLAENIYLKIEPLLSKTAGGTNN